MRCVSLDTKRSVTCVILPNDLQLLPYEDPPLAHGATHTGVGYAGPAKLPEQALLRAAADVLNGGKKVAMLVGAGRAGSHRRGDRGCGAAARGCGEGASRQSRSRLTNFRMSLARSDFSAPSQVGT